MHNIFVKHKLPFHGVICQCKIAGSVVQKTKSKEWHSKINLGLNFSHHRLDGQQILSGHARQVADDDIDLGPTVSVRQQVDDVIARHACGFVIQKDLMHSSFFMRFSYL